MIPVWSPIFEASSLKTKLVIDGGMNNMDSIVALFLCDAAVPSRRARLEILFEISGNEMLSGSDII